MAWVERTVLETWAVNIKTLSAPGVAALVCALARLPAGAQTAAGGTVVRGKPLQIPDGHFPPGYLYTAADLPRLAGRSLPASGPHYLIGKFTCVAVRQDQATFTPFSFAPTSPLKAASRGQEAVLRVRFYGNMPRKLRVGAVIAPGPRSPLTLKRVVRANGGALLADAEYWGTP